jgi:Peptidase family M1 domain
MTTTIILKKRFPILQGLLCFFLMLGLLGAQVADGDKTKKKDTHKAGTLIPPANDKEQVPEPELGPIVSYLIEAQLEPSARKLRATETMSWRNTTSHTVNQLRFHLYYNGFRSLNTSFLKEGKYYRKSNSTLSKLKFGEIQIQEIHRINGGNLTANTRYVSPDDNNPDDRTVMEIQLKEPVAPDQTIRLRIRFTLIIPQIFARTGMAGDYFFFAQWFPKIGVLQDDGRWHCHQFHYQSEFFADYGDYKVVLKNIPKKYIVGASGNLVKEEKNTDGSVTYFFEEKNIHDFAWTAYPYFKKVTDFIQLKGNPTKTKIELLLAPDHQQYQQRHLDSLKFAMTFYADHIMPYPYRKITIVDPPLEGIASGGMEYPTLFTTASMSLIPDAIKVPEMVTIHEFGHEYWYGIIGSDEFREAWLDEGINSYVEMEILEEYFNNGAEAINSWIIKASSEAMHRIRYTSLERVDPAGQFSWNFMNRRQYALNVYSKIAILMKSLRNLVGKKRMLSFLKFYTHKYKFKHPTGKDFVATFNTFMEEDFSWAFDEFVFTPNHLDQAVYSVKSSKLTEVPKSYRNEVVFVRKEGYFPSELLITLENGKEIKVFWKEREKWKRVLFDDPSPIKQAVIDPHYKIPLDRNYLNNSIVRKPDHSGLRRLALRFGFLFQNVVSFLTF